MRLYDKLPDSVEFNGKRIRLDLDFRNVIRMIDTISKDDILPEAREYCALKCICKHPVSGMYPAVADLLGFKPHEARQKVTDFEQDADLIRAAFLQVYGINLFRDRLHWFEFSALLTGLPEGNKYTDVLSIRSRPIPEATKYNEKEREWLIRAKAEYSLKYSEQEIERNYSESVKKIGAFLISLAGDGGK